MAAPAALGEVAQPAGQEFGDLSRIITGAKRWANAPKTREGYEFGDLFVKSMLKNALGAAEEPTAEVAIHTEEVYTEEELRTSHRLEQKRKDSVAVLEQYIPLINLRWKELEAKAADQTTTRLTGVEQASLVRLRGICFASATHCSPAVHKFQKALEEATGIFLDAKMVRSLSASGQLTIVQRALERLWDVAQECQKCVSEVDAVQEM